MTTDIVTSVSARGFVVADYDTATFSLSFTEQAPKAKAAKLKLKKGVETITAAIDALKEKGLVLLKSSYRTNVSVQPHYEYNQRTQTHDLLGQQATYSVVFQTPTLEMVSEAYDALSELNVNQYTVQSPTYSLRAEAALKQEALEDAWKTAQVLFGNQCKTLGLDANNYEVCSWDVDYSGQGGRMAKGRNFLNSAYSAGAAPEALGGGEPIELNAGRAMVEVILTVNYTRKPL